MFKQFLQVELLSIGTLLAYTMVTLSVLVSRYQLGVQNVYDNNISETKARTIKWLQSLSLKSDASQSDFPDEVTKAKYQPITNEEETRNGDDVGVKEKANQSTAFYAKVSVFFLVVGIAGLAVVLLFAFDCVSKPEWWAIFLVCIFSGTIVVSLVALQLHPQTNAKFPFMAPGVPFIPAISIVINVLLMANLQWMTYARFGIWMAIGKLNFYPKNSVTALLLFFGTIR